MPKKIPLTSADKELIESVYNIDIQINNVNGDNSKNIHKLMEQSLENASNYLKRRKMGHKLSLLDENNLFKSVVHLGEKLGLSDIPRRIECYDISHLQGKFVYGSMVTFIDGRSEKKFYRLFKCPDGNNDFLNHKNVLTRRFQKYLDNPENKGWALPDLIIVDGGKGQLSGNWEILKSFGFQDKVDLVALAKREEEVFLPEEIHKSFVESNKNIKLGKEGGLILGGGSLYLIQRLRDEAHRFAITNNRKARLRQVKKSDLDNINGVGEKTKQKILTEFGSVKGLIQKMDTNRDIVIEVIGYRLYNVIKNHYRL